MDLIDVAIPNRSYANLAFEWNIHRPIMFSMFSGIRFPVSDSLQTYIDFRIAALTDSRDVKKKTRTNRANRIRNTILKPLLESGEITQEQLNMYKTLPYNHPTIKVNLANILSDVRINETNTPAN